MANDERRMTRWAREAAAATFHPRGTRLLLARAHVCDPLTRLARVTLDGKDISSDCYAADAVRGLALCYQKDDTGNVVEDPARPGRLLREARRGHVEIVLDFPRVVVGLVVDAP